MKLIRLATSGFKKLDKFECDFTSGLNVIIGDNAAGKSTLLQALEASLYGPSVLPGNKDHITTWGREKWSLSLTFEIHGAEYTVTRTKSTAKLMKGDNLEANGSSPVTKHIEELMGLNAKDYNLFMQSRQGDTTGILTFGATALSRKVEEFAGISLIDKVQSLANEEWSKGRAQAEALTPDESVIADLEAQQCELLSKEATMSLEIADLEAELESLPKVDEILEEFGTSPKDLRATVRDLEKQAKDYIRRESQVEQLQDHLTTAQGFLIEAEEDLKANPPPAEIGDIEPRINELKRSVRHDRWMELELHQQSSNIERLEKQLAKAAAALDETQDLSAELDHAQKAYEYAEQELVDARATASAAKAHLDSLGKMQDGAECPTCGTFLADHDPAQLGADIQEAKANWESLNNSAEMVRTTAAKNKKALSDLQDQQRAWQQATKDFDQLEEEMAEAKKQFSESTADGDEDFYIARREEGHKELTKLESTLALTEDSLNRHTTAARRVNTRKAKCEDIGQDLAEAKERLAGMSPVDQRKIDETSEEADKLERIIEKANAAVASLKDAMAEAKSGYNDIVSRLNHIKERGAEYARNQDKANEYAKAADKGGRLSRFLRDRRGEYLTEVWNTVIGVASKQVNSASQGKIQSLRYQDGEFVFEEDGMLAPVGCASGAQKAHIGVALRIGLSRALYGSDALLIFDEPTESMREHNAVGLSASLASAGSQVLLITHREQDQDLAHNIIEVG